MSSTRQQSTHPTGEDGVVRCKHGEPATRLVSHTDRNPERAFYKCSRFFSTSPERCEFFFWADDPIFSRPTVPQHPMSSQQSGRLNGRFTPQTTPTKRKAVEASGSSQTISSGSASANTASKKARLAAIEAGLQARREDESARRPGVLPFTDGVDHVASPTSDVGTEVESPPTWYSFLGLPPSQETQPSTPQKRTAHDRRGETASSALMTPPQTVRQGTSRVNGFAANSRPQPVTPTRSKGKERAAPQWDVEENPFVDDNSFIRETMETLRQRAPSPDAQSLSELTTAECITMDVREMTDLIGVLYKRVERLNARDPCRYIERLERFKKALELADNLKKKRIAELEEELKQKDMLIKCLTEQLTARQA